MGLEVLYEDNHIIVVNKRPSDIVQGDKTGDKPLSEFVKDYIKKKYNKPGAVYLGTVHRIDRPVSGALIFARTSKALERLNKMFREKTVQKTYWAVVKNAPDEPAAELVHYLKKDQKANRSKAYGKEIHGSKKAELSYRIAGKGDRYHFLEVKPATGRHHQIRVQLSKIGCPIKGDLKYGFDRSNKDASIHLHARKLEFIHPVKQEPFSITAPPPKDVLWDEFLRLSGN
jgi:23S rRNA pseudouridine1911/1915/1917 synthase